MHTTQFFSDIVYPKKRDENMLSLTTCNGLTLLRFQTKQIVLFCQSFTLDLTKCLKRIKSFTCTLWLITTYPFMLLYSASSVLANSSLRVYCTVDLLALAEEEIQPFK